MPRMTYTQLLDENIRLRAHANTIEQRLAEATDKASNLERVVQRLKLLLNVRY